MVPRVPQHLLNAALKKLTLLLAAATLINEAKRKKNAPLKLLPDRTFVATRAREELKTVYFCLLYTSPSPRDKRQSRMPSSA